jgi:sortase A
MSISFRHADATSSRSLISTIWPDRRRVALSAQGLIRRAIPRTYSIEHLILAVAVVSLSWFGFNSFSTTREEAALASELEQLRITATSSPVTEPGRPALTARLTVGAVIGRIDVPRLKFSALAREGSDVRTLRNGVGHVPETAMPGEPGNATFAGYRDTVFRNLEGLKNGDEIVMTTTTGTYQYLVTATRVIAASEPLTLTPNQRNTLTLVTSYPFDYIGVAPERFIVRAEPVAQARRQ